MEGGVVRETWAHSHWPNNTNENTISQTQYNSTNPDSQAGGEDKK